MNSTSLIGNRGPVNILVTGSSSGIGEATVRSLARYGINVHAGVRAVADYRRLEGIGANVLPVYLDVTDQASVNRAVEEIHGRCSGMLDALVNNAGIAVVGPLEQLDAELWKEQMEVNVVGIARVTKEFLPLLRQTRGTIVNIGSAASHLALPMFGPYSASKRAVEGLTDALRREVRPLGVRVVLIHPGQTATPIYPKSEARAEQVLGAKGIPTVDPYYQVLRRIQDLMQSRSALRGSPERVAKVVCKALLSRRPKPVYSVGWDAKLAEIIDGWVPKRVVDWAISMKLGS